MSILEEFYVSRHRVRVEDQIWLWPWPQLDYVKNTYAKLEVYPDYGYQDLASINWKLDKHENYTSRAMSKLKLMST